MAKRTFWMRALVTLGWVMTLALPAGTLAGTCNQRL
jgi:hypothetical protein